MAASLLRDGTLGFDGVPTTRFEPLYPIFVAALRALTGDRVLVAQMIQVAIGSLAAVCLFHLTDVADGQPARGVFAAGLFAVYPLAIRHSADGTDITLMATPVLASPAGCSSWRRPAAQAAIAGALMGLATLTRTMALPLVVLAALLLLRERRPRAALAFTAAALAVFAPYAIRNYSLNGAMLPDAYRREPARLELGVPRRRWFRSTTRTCWRITPNRCSSGTASVRTTG